MGRAVVLGLLVAGLPGCRLPPEREPLKALVEDGAHYTFQELLLRARVQATVALEAFYVDNWTDLEAAGLAMEQTARFLPRSTDQPSSLKGTLAQAASDLGKEAMRLADAARRKHVAGATEAIQRITLQVRLLKIRD